MGGNILRLARPGAAAPPRARRSRPGLPFILFPKFPPGGCKTTTEKTSAAAAAADAGLVFYKYGCHRIIHEMDIRTGPRRWWLQRKPQASAGRVCNDIGSTLCSGRGK